MVSAHFEFTLPTTLTSVQAWQRIADVRGHSDVVPLTTGVGPEPSQLRVGDRLIARTALGPWGFDDVMLVREAEPGKLLVLEKAGRVLGGSVRVEFVKPRTTDGGEHTRQGWVVWAQVVEFPWLRRVPTPVATVVTQVAARVMKAGYQRFVPRIVSAPPAPKVDTQRG